MALAYPFNRNVDLNHARQNHARISNALAHAEGERRQDLLLCMYGWQNQINRLLEVDRVSNREKERA